MTLRRRASSTKIVPIVVRDPGCLVCAEAPGKWSESWDWDRRGGNVCSHTTKYLETRNNKGYPSLRQGVGDIMRRISATLPDLKEPVKMYLAGGMAVNFYTGYRPTGDIDASFSHRILLPKAKGLAVTYEDEEGCARVVYFNMNYNTALTLGHPDFNEDAYRVRGAEFENEKLELSILSPVDLAVSKISRFEDNDREDIAELARHGLIQEAAL